MASVRAAMCWGLWLGASTSPGCKWIASDAYVFKVADRDNDGHAAVLAGFDDCDDGDPQVHPGQPERCDNGIDDNCDGVIDDFGEGSITWWIDNDDDGWGTDSANRQACADWLTGKGWSTQAGDCDDSREGINPSVEDDDCDGVDEDCSGIPDDQALYSDWYLDGDLDQYGDPDEAVSDCGQPDGYVGVAGDCDDADATIHPTASDVCDSVDNDCDGVTDEDEPPILCYIDTDDDLHGDPTITHIACDCVAPWVADNTDCNDTDADIHTDHGELCDGIDNDCDQVTDEPEDLVFTDYFPDNDRDGFGDGTLPPVNQCADPSTPLQPYADNGDDCDDTDPFAAPGLPEQCDDTDNDCNGLEDEGLPQFMYWHDDDGDGLGDPDAPADDCWAQPPPGTAANDLDCDDTSVAIGQLIWYDDVDGDGYGDPATGAITCMPPFPWSVLDDQDCDDLDNQVHPNVIEVCNDGVDNNCDPTDDCSLLGTHQLADYPTISNGFERLGQVLDTTPDLNGDGIREILVADPEATGNEVGAGVVYLYQSPHDDGFMHIDGKYIGQGLDENAGHSLSAGADVTSDGIPDVLIGAPFAGIMSTTGFPDFTPIRTTGIVWVTAARRLDIPLETTADVLPITGGDADEIGLFTDRLADHPVAGSRSLVIGGYNVVYLIPVPVLAGGDAPDLAATEYVVPGTVTTVLPMQDQNGDGVPDLGIGYTDGVTSTFSIVDGSAVDVVDIAAVELGSYWSAQDGGFTSSVSVDLDADGVNELALAMPFASTSADRVGSLFVLAQPHPVSAMIDAEAMSTMTGMLADDRIGVSVAAGDITGNDGTQDLIVGMFADSSGAVAVIPGQVALEGDLTISDQMAPASFRGPTTTSEASFVLSGHDLDGDLVDDFVVGAPGDVDLVYIIWGLGL